MSLFDLPEEQRKKVLEKRGITEEEYRQELEGFEKFVKENLKTHDTKRAVLNSDSMKKFKGELKVFHED